MTAHAAQAFCAEFAADLRGRLGDAPELAPFIAGLDAAEALMPGRADIPMPPAALTHLPAALAGLGCSTAMAAAVHSLSAVAEWYRMLEGAAVPAPLVEGLLVGRVPLPEETPVRLGLFLLAPHIHYPLHQHAADEIYYVISGRLWLNMGCTADPDEVPAGRYSITPPHRVHALATRDEPCMIAYCWTSALSGPAWWWDRDDAGAWWRTRWDRRQDGRWIAAERQEVDDGVLREAGEI